MFALVYSQEIQEFYICKSKNVIQEDDGVNILALKVKLLHTHESKHELHEYLKYLLANVTSNKDLSEVHLITVENKDLSFQGDNKSEIDIQEHEVNDTNIDLGNLHMNMNTEESSNKAKQCEDIEDSKNIEVQDLPSTETYVERNEDVGKADSVCNKLSKRNIHSPNFEEIVPKIMKEEMIEIIENDEIIKLYGLLEIQNYGDEHFKRIELEMQILARILVEMRKKDDTIKAFSEIFVPKHIENLKLVCSNEPIKSINCDDLLYKSGKIFYNLVNLETNDIEKKKDIQTFLEQLMGDSASEKTKATKQKLHIPIKVESSTGHAEVKAEQDTIPSNVIENRGRKRNNVTDISSKELAIDLLIQDYQIDGNENTNKSTFNKKKTSCCFCGKRFIDILSHVTRQHKDEELVKKLNSLPKGAPKKRKVLENLLKSSSSGCKSPGEDDNGATEFSVTAPKDIGLGKADNLILWNMLQDHVNCSKVD